MGGFWEQLQFVFYSKQFGCKECLQFYESMFILFENGVLLKDVVVEVYKIFVYEGQYLFYLVVIVSCEVLMGLFNGKCLVIVMVFYLFVQE